MVTGNQKQYAAHRGVSPVAVHKAVKRGRISLDADGKINFEMADKLWPRGANVPTETAGTASGRKPSAAKHAPVDQEYAEGSFLNARTRREQAEAQLSELKLQKARGELIEAAEAKTIFGGIGKMFSAAREGFPAQVAPLLAGKTDLGEIELIIRRELRARDERVANEIESRHAELVGSGRSE